jgi:predicted NBD/HSP70 family sugar kinase
LYKLITDTACNIPSGYEYYIGIGIPGSINLDTVFVQNSNTACLTGKQLKTDLEILPGKKIETDNDADRVTLAESLAGTAKG